MGGWVLPRKKYGWVLTNLCQKKCCFRKERGAKECRERVSLRPSKAAPPITRTAFRLGHSKTLNNMSQMVHTSSLLRLLALVGLLCVAPFSALSADMGYTCSPPKAYGGLGFCGPMQCSAATTTKPACDYQASAPSINYAQRVSQIRCRQCTQVSY